MDELKPPKYEREVVAILSQKRWPPLDDDTKPMPVVRDDGQAVAICVALIFAGVVIGFVLALLLR